jgi:hypothetical protein
MAASGSLKVLGIFGRTDSAGAAVPDLDQEELRLLTTGTVTSGLLRNALDQTANANAFQVRQNTGSDLNVKVGSGTTKRDLLVIPGTAAGQGFYVARLDAATLTVSVPAADSVNPARYGVYAFVDDAGYSGDASRAYVGISCIRGTPAGSPTTPGPLATWSAYYLLWEFQLAANATAVTNTILDSGSSIDQRRSALPAIGARGQVAYAEVTANQAGISTVVDLTSLTVTWNALANRRYLISGYVRALQNTSTGDVSCTITDGSNAVKANALQTAPAANYRMLEPKEVVTPGAGSVTRKLRMTTTAGTVDLSAAATAKSYIMVEDIGPV